MFEDIRLKRREAPEDPANTEKSLNQLGYELLWKEYRDAAIGAFLLNGEFNSRSAHCCDRLAEAYDHIGDQTNALKSLRQAIELLDRFPDKNKDYESSRAAIARKLQKLETDSKKMEKPQ